MFTGAFQPMHLLLILIVVLIIFGPGKLPDVGKAMGKTIREFKRSAQADMEEEETGAKDQIAKTEAQK
ncbi:MAG: twin-arginine translocase TatA/TatE family subunit [Desulfotomaculaceae bacterium]|nr:twin-arginine translocase TatA/TatE family subunit [Desulfotomaculaceae bacterium]